VGIHCGWDIGGVHLKVGCLRAAGGVGAGRRFAWRQEAFEIWRAPTRLGKRLAWLRDAILHEVGVDPRAPAREVRHAVTMTAELSDLFPDRLTGVRTILAAGRQALGEAGGAAGDLVVLGTRGELLPLAEALEAPRRVAAANWLATAGLAARLQAARGVPSPALLIDVGSTTTDIVALCRGRPDPVGDGDVERLQSGELVYTGLLRTPPAALADRVPLGDGWCRVAPEHFTIMADVQVMLGRIGPGEYTIPTPDGRGRSRAECAARLARLVCSEPADLGAEALQRIAAFLEERQIERIAEAVRQVGSRCATVAAGAPNGDPMALVAGAGWFLGEAAARRAGWHAARLSGMLPGLGAGWDVVAPAAALALLLAEASGDPMPIAAAS